MTDDQYQEAFRKHQEALAKEQAETARLLNQAAAQVQRVQHEINTRPLRKYASIVAVDVHGGFSKDGQIPWHYPADFKWFQNKTKGNVCIMGRATYDDINKRLGDKAEISVLPNRKCFVVTSRPLERSNATPVACIGDIDVILDRENVPYDQTIFFCGGERIYQEAMSKVDTVYMTVINKDAECDRFFPRTSMMKSFAVLKVEQPADTPEIAFVTWGRNKI